MATTTAPNPIAPAKRRRRWWRVIVLLIGVALCVSLAMWGYGTFTTQRAWIEAEAEAARDLPRWKLLELEADRPAIPDAENSGVFMMALRARAGNLQVSGAKNYDQIFEKLSPAAQLNGQQETTIRDRLKIIAKEIVDARKLKDMPRGRFPVIYSDDGFGSLLPNHHDGRTIADWLQHDAWLLAQDKQFNEAVDSCRAILVGSRVCESDPFLIAFLVRVSKQSIGLAALERVLAQGEASEETLRAMQTAIEHEINTSSWVHAVRGERALVHHLFENLRDGKIKSGWLNVMGGPSGRNAIEETQMWFASQFPSTVLKYYPEFLRHNNRYVEISKLPIHERIAKIADLERDVKDTPNPVIRLLAPALQKCHNAECRSQANLRAALVAVACECYRLKNKDRAWPATLDVLVKEKLLNAIPGDPMDGQPMRFRRTRDGIVVYSIWLNQKDDEGEVERDRITGESPDLGFRLWNVDRRRQPALPPIIIQD